MIATLIIGLVAGWLAGMLMRGSGYGLVMDLLLGLIGAVVGRWIFSALGIVAFGTVGYLAMATVGALALVGATHLLKRAV
jgi:uncharacterized membrane protein YeaQ/YmgE (transglycosylase-associated protein family)